MGQIQRYTVYQLNPIQDDGLSFADTSYLENGSLVEAGMRDLGWGTEISHHYSEDKAKEAGQQYADTASRDVLVTEDTVIEWPNGFVENVENRVNEWFLNP